MEASDPRAAAERFRDLYRRWDGLIPLDDLAPYLAWYQRLAPDDQTRFRVRAIHLLIDAYHDSSHARAQRIWARFRLWFVPRG